MRRGSRMDGEAPPARVRLVPAALAVAPSLVLAVASVWWTLTAPVGGGLWPPASQTLSEAVATGDVGEVVWQVRTGADPNARTTVRSGMLTNRAVTLTPLEAAVWARDPDMIRLLIDQGAVADQTTVAALRCLNVEQGNDPRIDAALAPDAAPLPAACDTASPTR